MVWNDRGSRWWSCFLGLIFSLLALSSWWIAAFYPALLVTNTIHRTQVRSATDLGMIDEIQRGCRLGFEDISHAFDLMHEGKNISAVILF